MPVQPNVVVGAVGVAVVLVVGAILVQNWETLTEIEDFQVDVVTETHDRHLAGTTAAGATSERTFDVAQRNVTVLTGQLTWRDNTPADQPAEVTLKVYRPDGRQVVDATGSSGVKGLEFDVRLGETPEERAYKDTNETAQAKFEADYPPSDDGTGQWRFEVTVRYGGTSPLGGGSVDWQFDARWENWSAFLQKVPPTDFRVK